MINKLVDENQIKISLKKLKKITFILIYSLFAFYFLINGPGIFNEWDNSWAWSTIIYLVGVSLFLGIQEKLPKDLQSPISHSILGFSLAFLGATALFIVLRDAGWYFTEVVTLPSAKIPAMFTYQLVIVCASEEIIFRGVIYRYLRQFGVYPAVFVSAIIFALFHLVAYGGNVSAMAIAFFMGIVLALCVERWNLGVALGIHFAWNAFILGITALV